MAHSRSSFNRRLAAAAEQHSQASFSVTHSWGHSALWWPHSVSAHAHALCPPSTLGGRLGRQGLENVFPAPAFRVPTHRQDDVCGLILTSLHPGSGLLPQLIQLLPDGPPGCSRPHSPDWVPGGSMTPWFLSNWQGWVIQDAHVTC